jgi:hypothetical protein
MTGVDGRFSIRSRSRISCVAARPSITGCATTTTNHPISTAQHDTTRHDTTRHDTPRHATPRHATTRHDTPRHATHHFDVHEDEIESAALGDGVEVYAEGLLAVVGSLAVVAPPLEEPQNDPLVDRIVLSHQDPLRRHRLALLSTQTENQKRNQKRKHVVVRTCVCVVCAVRAVGVCGTLALSVSSCDWRAWFSLSFSLARLCCTQKKNTENNF